MTDDDITRTTITVDAEAWRKHKAQATLADRTLSEHLSVVLRERHGLSEEDSA